MRLIGEILLEVSELNRESLDRGLEVQKDKGGRIGEILLHQKAIQEVLEITKMDSIIGVYADERDAVAALAA